MWTMKAAQHTEPRKTSRYAFVPAIFLAAAVFAGCGSEMTTNPVSLSTQSVNTDVGELVLPGDDASISAPKAVVAVYGAPNGMVVTWADPGQPFEAIILRDGQEVGRVPAQDGAFSDTLPPRIPGVNAFAYSVCFGRGTRLGPETFTTGVLPRQDRQGPGPSTISDSN